jgi:hypothetical protein
MDKFIILALALFVFYLLYRHRNEQGASKIDSKNTKRIEELSRIIRKIEHASRCWSGPFVDDSWKTYCNLVYDEYERLTDKKIDRVY